MKQNIFIDNFSKMTTNSKNKNFNEKEEYRNEEIKFIRIQNVW